MRKPPAGFSPLNARQSEIKSEQGKRTELRGPQDRKSARGAAALAGKVVWGTQISQIAASGLPRASRRASSREKVFGLGRPRALDRNAKARIMHWARCVAREKASGGQRGVVTRAAPNTQKIES